MLMRQNLVQPQSTAPKNLHLSAQQHSPKRNHTHYRHWLSWCCWRRSFL